MLYHGILQVYNGYWFSPEMQFVSTAMQQCQVMSALKLLIGPPMPCLCLPYRGAPVVSPAVQPVVTGSVDLQLFKGNVIERGRSSPCALNPLFLQGPCLTETNAVRSASSEYTNSGTGVPTRCQ